MMLLFFCTWAPVALSQGYSISPAPDWVRPMQVPSVEKEKQQNSCNGVALLLLDKQWRVDNREQSRYSHYVSKALNTSGVEKLSQIAVNFDPSYETLTVHQVLIHREGVSIDKLERAQIHLIQREMKLEYRIYDGSKTLNMLLEDVRVGDTIEYSYSINGANPVFSGHFAEQLDMRWEVPVARYHYRILWPTKRHLFMRNHRTDLEPVERVGSTHIEYIWQQSNVVALPKDSNVPNWYDAFPRVYLSDFSGWTEVGNWAWPLYEPITNTPALQEVIKSIENTSASGEERVLTALQFVQNEVRYLGIEMGVRSHKPNTPDAVLRLRFGDCKDKSRLLISLLQGMGIEAYAALVNTFNGKMIKDALPTPKRFNHVIVQVEHQGKTYWLDPTMSYQQGNLEAIYQPDYKYALVITGENAKLESMSDTRIVRYQYKEVEEFFDISGGDNTPATYRIQNHFLKYFAESMRRELSESSLERLQQSYLNYTARFYPDVQVEEKINVVDDQKTNRITLTEQYTIPNIWQPSENDGIMRVEFVPFLMLEVLKKVNTPKRTMPYAIHSPVEYRQVSKIKVPENSHFEDEFHEIKDNIFRFSRKISFNNDILSIEYKYRSYYDSVSPEGIKRYSENINKSIGLMWYSIERDQNNVENRTPKFNLEDINWRLIYSSLLVTIFFPHHFLL